MMYKKVKIRKSTIELNNSIEGETIEMKMERIMENKEPIKDGAPAIYTERRDGVQAGYNIRTDRFEVAVDAMDFVTKSNINKRMENIKNKESKVIDMNTGSGEAKGTGATE